jgi:hypothetical protein
MQQPAASEGMSLTSGTGGGWSIVTSPNAAAAQPKSTFFGVTCVSASDCWAVGYYVNGTTGLYQTLIERWDGTSWAIVSSPNTSATQYNYLFGVTCVSASECWAVGYYNAGNVASSTVQTLIERWDGTSWAIVSSPNTSATQTNLLLGVTCVSASSCWAVGYYINGSTNQTLVERWDGTSWAVVSSPNTSATQSNLLNGVTCVSALDCWAVGTYYNSTIQTYQTLVERWNGTSWAIVTSPNALAMQTNLLNGVTCASASDCWAVGFYNTATTTQPLIERWQGASWAVVNSANTSAPQNNYLSGVTCTSASDCWAVGYYRGDQTLIERWDGTSWAIVSSPNTSATQNNELYGVTCVSASDCWAVGRYSNGMLGLTLIEHWDGTSWSIVTSPNPLITQTNWLYAVTCVSASDCWAVGDAYNRITSTWETLTERWDGTSWTIVSSANTGPTQHNHLFGVTCVSASDCWAVGYDTASGYVQTLIEHWDGTSWAIASSPNTNATQNNSLNGVTCTSASDCWAVGQYNPGGPYQTLIEHWDGTAWAIVNSPNTSATESNFLSAVTCASASDCWAVGDYFGGSGIAQTLIERWDGTSWTIVNSPNTSNTLSNFLFGVACAASSDCWTVGNSDTGAIAQTLIERYTKSSSLIPTSVVSRKTHGTAGDFDIDLPLAGNPGIECRSGGTNNDYQLVFTFLNNISVASASVTSGTGSVSSSAIGPSPNQYTVNLTGVTNAQYLTVTLNGALDSTGNSGNIVGPQMGVLVGDVNASGVVTSGDTNLSKAQALQPVTVDNFRNDINASGSITTGGVNLIKQNALSHL